MALGPFEPGAVSNETLADGQRDESRFGEIAGVNENVGTVILGSQKSEAAICEKSFDSTCIHALGAYRQHPQDLLPVVA